MATSKQPTGVEVRGETIRIVFMYRGQRCRESLPGLKATKPNIKFAANKRAVILHEIATGVFDYADHFPESNKAKMFSGRAVKERLVKDALTHWLSVKEATLAHSTVVNYRSKANTHILPMFGDRPIRSITKTEVEQWAAVYLAELKNKTINEVMIVFRGIFKDAVADGIVAVNPLSLIENRKVKKQEPDPFTKSEIAKILAAETARTQEVTMMKFAFWTGVRISELIALSWDDIDFDRGIARVRRANVKGYYKVPKTRGSVREVELLKPALDALREQKPFTYLIPAEKINVTQEDNRTVEQESWRPIWRNSLSGSPHANDGVVRDRFWKNHLVKAKVRYRGPNHARHTFASQLLSTGMISKDWIAQQMGHTSTKMLDDHYAKWIPEDAPPMAEMVNSIMGFSDQNAPDMPQEIERVR
ncbi:MAG: site-specific integrase [Amphritea sp.]|nr:site-specific integrase [Amphritea sp.]